MGCRSRTSPRLFDRGGHLSPHLVFVGVPGRAFTLHFVVCRGERGPEPRDARRFEVANPHADACFRRRPITDERWCFWAGISNYLGAAVCSQSLDNGELLRTSPHFSTVVAVLRPTLCSLASPAGLSRCILPFAEENGVPNREMQRRFEVANPHADAVSGVDLSPMSDGVSGPELAIILGAAVCS